MSEVFLTIAAGSAPADAAPWLQKYFDVHHTWEVWWLVLGFAAQALFFSRWIIQWVASERRGESHVPMLFWWCSIVGASMLLVYFIGRREPVGILGQLTGWIVYSRNIYLIRRRRRTVGDRPASSDDEGRGVTS